jgi:Beta-propeller repeat
VGRYPSVAYGVAVDTAGNIYVAGSAQATQKGFYSDQWVVRRSTNGGSTWSTVDNFTLESSRNYQAPLGWPTKITIAPSGDLFVCGFLTASDGSRHWLTRQGIPGSKGALQWSTTDSYQLVSGASAAANGITSDSQGNIFATGRAADTAGVDHWVTRRLGQ